MAKFTLDLTQPEASVLAEFSSVMDGTTFRVLTDGSGDPYLDLRRSWSTGIEAVRWLTPGETQDMQLLARMRVLNDDNTFTSTNYFHGLTLRAKTVAGAVSAYSSAHGNSTTRHRLRSHVNQTGTGDGTFMGQVDDANVPWTSYHWRRFEALGNIIRVKWWLGALEDEPTGWNQSVTNTAHAAGWMGLLYSWRLANRGILQCTHLYGATDGDIAAPGPDPLAPPILLAGDPGVNSILWTAQKP